MFNQYLNMESYGLEMDELFDDRDVADDLNEFETVPENTDGADPEEGAANDTQNGWLKLFIVGRCN